jgi:hypothetical protein
MKRVVIPALFEAKIALYSTMRANKIGQAELARPPQLPSAPRWTGSWI